MMSMVAVKDNKDRAEAHEYALAASASQSPVVIFGPLRGGTTMMRLMLDGHDALSVPGESDFLFDHVRQQEGSWRIDRAELATNRIYQDSGIKLADNLDGEDAVRDMIAQIGNVGSGRPVLMLHRELEKAAALNPDMKVIRILRDPRDVARSAIGMEWAGNVFHGLDPWLATERSWQAFATAYPEVPRLIIRYEDLVSQPEPVLRSICHFLEIPYSPEMLSYPSRSTYGAPDPTRVFQWRKKMPKSDIALVEARAGDAWAHCGYELSGQPRRTIGQIERRWLWLQNRASVWRKMFRRYGLIDPIIRGAGRRLGIGALQRQAVIRMDNIDRKNLK